jgi:hypothetical protein
MAIHRPRSAPESRLPESKRGAAVGRVCLACGNVYPRHAPAHSGKPLQGKDHVDSPCSYEGQPFRAGSDWWETAVEVLEPPRDES